MQLPECVAVVMGSGFSLQDGVHELSESAQARLDMAVFLYVVGRVVGRIVVVGWEKDQGPKFTRYFAPEAKRYLISKGVPATAIIMGSLLDSNDTRADVESALEVIRKQGFANLEILVITESPHWRFRVEPIFQELAPGLNVSFQSSGASVSPFYWIKEALAGSLISAMGDRSGPYGRIRKIGKALIRFFRR